MTTQEFGAVLVHRLSRIQAVLGQKAAEYAHGGDRLSNFKRAAASMQTTPESACVGFWMKHVVSLLDLVDEIESGAVALGIWDEKIGDAINYLILLEALVHERHAKTFKPHAHPEVAPPCPF